MYKYSKSDNILSKLEPVSFSSEFLKETNIEEWVKYNPEIIGDDIKIIAQQFDKFDFTSERADLVAIDGDGDVVIVELKRDNSGRDVHWQAIKYASYFSKATIDELATIYRDYLLLNSKKQITKSEAKNELYDHVYNKDKYEDEEDFRFNVNQKIVLISHEFSKEVLSAVMWLRRKSSFDGETKINIKCIQIKPYKQGDDIILSIKTIIPPEEIAEISVDTDAFFNQSNVNSIDDRIDTYRKTIISELSQFKWKMPIGKAYIDFYYRSDLWVSCYVRRQKLDIRIEIGTSEQSQHQIIDNYFSMLKSNSKLNDFQTEIGSRNPNWKRVFKIVKINSMEDLASKDIIEQTKQIVIELDRIVNH